MLEIRSIRKTYGAAVAVDGLDLSIRAGETFGLLGPNGAGKSKTIRCTLGIDEPDSGSVVLAGRGSPREPELRALVGYAPQEIALYSELTARENLRFFARMQGLGGARLRGRVEHALEFADLANRADDRVGTFSGGMKRRLNLGCAIVHEPAILLLDEPTVGVDPQSRNHLLTWIKALGRAGTTVLYTTHYIEEAERLCERVAIVDHGRVLACDRIDALLAAHGGRSTCEALVDGPVPAGFPGAVVDGVLRFEADDAGSALARLRDASIGFRSVQIRRPDLESVFLELTGRRLRDA